MIGSVRSRAVWLVSLILTNHTFSMTSNFFGRIKRTTILDPSTPNPGYTTEHTDETDKPNLEIQDLYQKVVMSWVYNVNTTVASCSDSFVISRGQNLNWRYMHYTTMFNTGQCPITWNLFNIPDEQLLMIFVVTVTSKYYDLAECETYITFPSGLSDNNTNVKLCSGTKGSVFQVISSPLSMLIWSAGGMTSASQTYVHFFKKDKIETTTETSTLISTHQTELSAAPATIDACRMRNACPDTYDCTLDSEGEYQCLCITGLCEETDNSVIIISTTIPVAMVFTVIFVLSWCKIRRGGVFKQKPRKIERFWEGTISKGHTIVKRKITVPSLSPILNTILEKDVQLQVTALLISPERIQMQEELGRGAFGTVYKGLYNPDENIKHVETVAIKALSDKCIGTDITAFANEALTMAEFTHCHVMSIIGVCINPQTDDPMIVLPFMENGDLKTYLRKFRYEKKDKEPPDENQLLMFCLHIARGMDYLSGLKFVHRDLAARNCMVDSNLVVKVADFGLTREVYTEAYYRQDQQKLLPVKWMALESLVDRVYTTYTDIWSFGVTMWEVLTLAMLPYPELDNADVINHLKAGKRMEPPEICPEEFHPLMTSCWNLKPADRPSFLEIATELSTYLAKTCDYLDVTGECKMADLSLTTDALSGSEASDGIDMEMPSTSWQSAVPNIYEERKCARE